MKPRTLLIATGLLLPLIAPTHAAVWTSSSAGGGNWSDGVNWAGGVPPVNDEAIEIGIPVAGGTRVTTNNFLTSIGSLWLKANLNEANGNAVTLDGNSVRYTAGGSSVGKVGMAITLTQNTTYEVSANTSTGRLEVGGGISGNFGITKLEGGRLRFVGTAKTYTGDTIISGGLLDMSATDMMPFGAGKGNVLVGAGADFFLNNFSTQINGLSDFNSTAGTVTKTGSNTRSLTLGNGDANGNFSGNMSFIGGTSTVNKVGTGSQTLGGNVTTAGAGGVFGGSLILNGTWANAVSVANTSTVGGTGSITGALTVASGGTVAPGTSIGTFAVGSSVISGTLLTEYNGTGAGTVDLLNVGGLLDIVNATADFSQISGVADDPFYVFANYGTLNGTFAAVTNLPSGYGIDYAFDNGSGTNHIALVAVPEPAAALLGALGLLGILPPPPYLMSRMLDTPADFPHESRTVPFLAFLLLLLILPARAAEDAPGVIVRVWQSQDGLPSNVVRSVVQSADGFLWMATAEGVTRFDGYDFQVYEPEGDLRRSRLAFYRLFATKSHGVWAATYQGGLFQVVGERLRRVVRNTREPNPPLVSQLVETAEGQLIFRKGDGFGRVTKEGVIQRMVSDAALLELFRADMEMQQAQGRVFQAANRPVLRDEMGREWIAGTSGGLMVAEDGGPATSVELPSRGEAFVVNELMEDRENNVWAASSVNGLIRIRPARVDVLDTNRGHSERAVSALMQDRRGVWWIANRRGGLDRWTPEETRYVPLSTSGYSRPAAALFEDKAERLWVASRDGSVFRLDDEGFKPQFSKSQVPSKVRSITQDSAGLLWFGGTQGLASFDGTTVRQFGPAEGVEKDDFTVIQPFPGGKVIAGSAAGRIVLGGSAGFETIAAPGTMRHQWISGILTFSATETWVSTLGSGLYLWDGSSWTSFDADDGLPDSRLTCVVADDLGAVWFGSLGGIIRAERKSLLAHARNPAAPVRWLLLDHTDGLPSRECIGGYQPAGWRADNGLLWFPTGSGIARVRPDVVQLNDVPPPIFLQSIRANGELHAASNGPLAVGPGRSRLEFRFVGLGFSAPEKITYRGRLAGLDDTWRELGNQRVAAFEAVPPGEYVFQVMAVNGDGLRSPEPAEISVTIRPNFWETAWFSAGAAGLVLLVAVGTGWLAARVRLKRRIQLMKIRHAREGERSRIARDLHDDLGASLTEISILAALAAEDAEDSPHQPALDQLSVKAKHVVGSLDEIVWAVNPREDTLRSLVDYIAAFAREFLDIARIPLRIEVERTIPERPLATAQRHGVFLAAREVLNNIVKHSAATEVKLAITLGDGCLEIRIEDNGCGFDPTEVAGGNGLGNLKQRMREASGDCAMESRRRHGTTVFLTLPLPAPAKPVS